MPGKTTRSSNLELLRILCMLLIIGDHLTGQSGIADYTTLPSSFAFCLIGCGSRIACSVFVLIGGWFLCEQPYKTRRPLSLWLSLWLYTVPVTLLCKLAGLDVSWDKPYHAADIISISERGCRIEQRNDVIDFTLLFKAFK